jgi:muramoyltetrapeptide carboxypeptidase
MSRTPETSPQTQWRLPPALKAGGTIYVCSAAGTVSGESLRAGMKQLSEAGFLLRHQPALVDSAGYLAGSDEARLADLSEAMLASDVDAIICARGGYGTMRLLDRLPWEAFAAQPKWLVGYSDITAFHLAAATRGIQTLHGPMVAGLEKHANARSRDTLLGALAGRPADWSGLRTRTAGAVTGRLLGGNLTMLAALAGTPFMPSLRGAILVLERSEERRVGKECQLGCRSRWSPYH